MFSPFSTAKAKKISKKELSNLTVKCDEGHLMHGPLLRPNGWCCDRAEKFGGPGCKRGLSGFKQADHILNFKCEKCGFYLCDLCATNEFHCPSSGKRKSVWGETISFVVSNKRKKIRQRSRRREIIQCTSSEDESDSDSSDLSRQFSDSSSDPQEFFRKHRWGNRKIRFKHRKKTNSCKRKCFLFTFASVILLGFLRLRSLLSNSNVVGESIDNSSENFDPNCPLELDDLFVGRICPDEAGSSCEAENGVWLCEADHTESGMFWSWGYREVKVVKKDTEHTAEAVADKDGFCGCHHGFERVQAGISYCFSKSGSNAALLKLREDGGAPSCEALSKDACADLYCMWHATRGKDVDNCHADFPEATCWPPDSVAIDCELMWSKIKKCEYVETSPTDNAMNRFFQNLDVVLYMFPKRTHGCVFHCLVEKAKGLFEKSSTLGCEADVLLVRNNNPDGVGRSVSTIVRNIFEATLEDRTFSFHYWQQDMVWLWNENLFKSCDVTANFNTLKENSWTWPKKVHSEEHIFWPFLHTFYQSIFEYSDPDILKLFRETYDYLPKVSKDESYFIDSMISLIHIRHDDKDKENLLTKSQQYADVWFNEFGSGDGKVLFIILTDDETAQRDFTGRLMQLGMDENRISKFAENDYFTKRSLNAQGKDFMHRVQSKLLLARVVDNIICTGTSHFCHTLWALRRPGTPVISMDTKEGMLCGTDCFLGDAEPKEYTYWPSGVGCKPVLRNVRDAKLNPVPAC